MTALLAIRDVAACYVAIGLLAAAWVFLAARYENQAAKIPLAASAMWPWALRDLGRLLKGDPR